MEKIFLVVQPSLSHYREPFVRELLSSSEYDFSIVGRYSKENSSSNAQDQVNSASNDLKERCGRVERVTLFGKFFWDRGIVSKIIQERYELVILEGNFYSLSTWIAALLLRLRGDRVAFWGHGWKRPESGVKLWLRKMFYKLPAAHFVYGNSAVRMAESVGIKTKNWFVVYNSLYPADYIHSSVANLKPENRGLNLVFSGRLTKRHRVDLLIRSIIELNSTRESKIRGTIVGMGSEYDSLLELSKGHEDEVIFLGAQHDFEVLAEVYLNADYAVSPGASGLNVIQALGFGVPVIAAEGDPESGPEIESIIEEKTGFLFRDANLDSLKETIQEAEAISVKARNRMATNSRNLVLEFYVAEKHAQAMLSGIKNLLTK